MTVSAWHRSAIRADGEEEGAPLSTKQWAVLVAEMQAHRTEGHLAWAVHEGRIPATDEQRSVIFDRHAALMHRALVIDDEARRVSRLVPAAIFVKGVAAAHLDRPDPSLRSYQDVDVLLPPLQVDAAVGALVATGAKRDLPPRSTDWDRRFAKDITFVGSSGVEVDLHRTLVPGPFGFALDLDELVAGLTTYELGGVEVRALGPERRVLASALALTAGEAVPRIAASLDMLGAIDRHGTDLDEIVRLAERWRIGVLVAEAVRWTGEQLGDDRLPIELRRWSVGRAEATWERRWRRLYRSAGGTNTITLLGAPLGMDQLRDRIGYLRGLIRPTAEYRAARDRTIRPREWRTGLAELLRGPRP